jgi:hypothetical protein
VLARATCRFARRTRMTNPGQLRSNFPSSRGHGIARGGATRKARCRRGSRGCPELGAARRMGPGKLNPGDSSSELLIGRRSTAALLGSRTRSVPPKPGRLSNGDEPHEMQRLCVGSSCVRLCVRVTVSAGLRSPTCARCFRKFSLSGPRPPKSWMVCLS